MANNVWREIDGALKRAGKTQEWLAGQLGLSNNAISKWKKTGKISRENVVAVSELLGISLDRLLLTKQHAVVAIFEGLPDALQDEALSNLEFQVHKGEKVFGSEKANSYVQMIERLKKDLAKRRGGG